MPVSCSPITTSLIRHIWEVVEETQSCTLLERDDREVVQQLLGQLQRQQSLNSQEIQNVINYLTPRISLIRDIASNRRGVVYG
jgi:hypothetical protein